MGIEISSKGYTGNYAYAGGISGLSKKNNSNFLRNENVSFGGVRILPKSSGFFSGFAKKVSTGIKNVMEKTGQIIKKSGEKIKTEVSDFMVRTSKKTENNMPVAVKQDTRTKDLRIDEAKFGRNKSSVNITLNNGESRLFGLSDNLPEGAVLTSKPIMNYNDGTVQVATLKQNGKNYDVVLDARTDAVLPSPEAITYKTLEIKSLPLAIETKKKTGTSAITLSGLNKALKTVKETEKTRKNREFVNSLKTTVNKFFGMFKKNG